MHPSDELLDIRRPISISSSINNQIPPMRAEEGPDDDPPKPLHPVLFPISFPYEDLLAIDPPTNVFL
jgi:hypothetical protein